MWALSFKLKDKLDKSNLREGSSFPGVVLTEREKGEEESFQNFSLRSTEFRRSEFVEPRTKVHLLDEGYTWILKTLDFTNDSSEELGKSKVSVLEVSTRLPRVSSTLQEVRILPTLVYFSL